MLDVLAQVIAPVLLTAVVGGWVCRRLGIAADVVSRLSYFLFSPALVYSSMSTIDLGGSSTARIVAVTAGVAVVTTAGGLFASTALRQDDRTRAAVGLTAGMANSGNLGLPVSELAFGAAGLEIAVVGFVTSAFVINTLGVIVAAGGSGRRLGGLGSVVGVPALWAAVVGFSVNSAGLDLPAVVTESAGTLGDAAVPVMLVVLGVQLVPTPSGAGGGGGGATPIVVSTAMRLLGGPLAALGLCVLAEVDGTVRDTLVVLGGMPAAVYTTILATQFGVRPPLVTRAVVIQTLAGVATLTVLIAHLR